MSTRLKSDPPAMEASLPSPKTKSKKSSSSSSKPHRDRHVGRRPTNYTASYTPPANLVRIAQQQRARAAEADATMTGEEDESYVSHDTSSVYGNVSVGTASTNHFPGGGGAYHHPTSGASVSSVAASVGAGSYASASYASVGGGSSYHHGRSGSSGGHQKVDPHSSTRNHHGRHKGDQDGIAEESYSPPPRRTVNVHEQQQRQRQQRQRHVQDYYPAQAPSSPNSTQACPSVAPSVYSQNTHQSMQTFQSTQTNLTSHSYQTNHTQQTNHTNPTAHAQQTNHSKPATIKHQQQITEQQIAEYAGKRALLRLEQEFLADNPDDDPRSSSSGRNAGLSKQRSAASILSRASNASTAATYNTYADDAHYDTPVSIASTHGNHAAQRRESNGAVTTQYQAKVISVMDRKKLARVPQVNKRDLVIGEYLGRGNFCDVFEVTWVLENGANANGGSGGVGRDGLYAMSAKGRKRSSSLDFQRGNDTKSGSSDSEDSHEEDTPKGQMEALSLACSNDLRPVFDLGQRRSISQISTTPQTNRYRAAVRGDAVITTGYTNPISSDASHAASTIRNPNVLALKCLRPAVRANPRKFVIGAEDLAHETALLACLDHPNIIQLHGRAEGCFSQAFQFGSGSSSGNGDSGKSSREKEQYHEGYFIILDRLVGSLSDRIEEWKDECRAINGVAPSSREIKLSETTLREHLYKRLKAAYCVADALEYLHSRNVVYRDLKPQNIGIDCYDCIKIFDFGFATSLAPYLNQPKRHGSYGPLTETCGTRRYMAPEVALKLGYGKEVDVYSFGMLLWEICAMEKPFDSIQSVEAFHDMVVLCGKRPSLHLDPLWTSSLKGLMSRCWSTDPYDRPTMAQVKNMLCNVLRDMNLSEIERANRMSNRGRDGVGVDGDGRKRVGVNQGDQQQVPGLPFFNKVRRRLTM
eukprot:CAMPEP_0171333374 /NCGR_PEP_ID=MMETSP0878-20121228/3982_1 /TAXON_ID=67004 /ORGANISM="Thalassiosira weissflogii, Strain CCMP1336" /LENGTH=922 /DNA_ID=CAMNT_0011834317 /DNA_START=298 /DNA_END=3066 /DNA_ORIENTATION=+